MKKLIFLSLLLIGSNIFGFQITNDARSDRVVGVSLYSISYKKLDSFYLNPGKTNSNETREKLKNAQKLYVIISGQTNRKFLYSTFYGGFVPGDAEVTVLSAFAQDGEVVGGGYYKDQTGKEVYLNKEGYEKAKEILGTSD